MGSQSSSGQSVKVDRDPKILEKQKLEKEMEDMIIQEVQLAEYLNHNLIGSPVFREEEPIRFKREGENLRTDRRVVKKRKDMGTLVRDGQVGIKNLNSATSFVSQSYIKDIANSLNTPCVTNSK